MEDDEHDTFQSLAAATASLLTQIEELERAHNTQQKRGSEEHRDRKDGDREKRHYVDHRLRELAVFEQRARGQGFKR